MNYTRKIKHRAHVALGVCIILGLMTGVLFCLITFMQLQSNPLPSGPSNSETIAARASNQLANNTFPYVDWGYWQSVNPDVIGWITIPDTAINYPIVQAHPHNPTYYLTHDIFQHYNIYGTPYLDAQCLSEGFSATHAIVFAHHMNDGSMFSDLAQFSSPSFAAAHKRILLQTPQEQWIKEVCFVQVVNADEQYKQNTFSTSEQYHAWYQEQLQSACVVLDKKEHDKILTLCTCSYTQFTNERTLVTAY